MKKKLSVLFGVGGSAEQGFPSTGQLDDEVAEWAADFVKNKAPDPIDSFDARTRTDYYRDSQNRQMGHRFARTQHESVVRGV